MSRQLTVAATQMACGWNIAENIEQAESMVREAACRGACVVLLQELFETPYFCIEQDCRHFKLATSADENPAIQRMSALAKELEVVLPVSWFECAGKAFFNSLAMIDADGSLLGVYRKIHIPNSIGYQEKTYFNPGDSGFRVWKTRYADIGAGICWDQWFPESARCMALMGAELLMFPTAIGSEPSEPALDSRNHWQNVMCGHAGANIMPLVASNRIGTEQASGSDMVMTFYGSSFIADPNGEKVEQAARDDPAVLTHTFDLDEIRRQREAWGVFRDRRPEMYAPMMSLDGRV